MFECPDCGSMYKGSGPVCDACQEIYDAATYCDSCGCEIENWNCLCYECQEVRDTLMPD